MSLKRESYRRIWVMEYRCLKAMEKKRENMSFAEEKGIYRVSSKSELQLVAVKDSSYQRSRQAGHCCGVTLGIVQSFARGGHSWSSSGASAEHARRDRSAL